MEVRSPGRTILNYPSPYPPPRKRGGGRGRGKMEVRSPGRTPQAPHAHPIRVRKRPRLLKCPPVQPLGTQASRLRGPRKQRAVGCSLRTVWNKLLV